MKRLLSGLLLIYCIWQSACIPPQSVEYGDVSVDFRDSIFQKISSLQDQQDLAKLYAYLEHPNPSYRFLAARAFGSIRTPEAIDSLAPLLVDTEDKVRASAAFAIGQTGEERAEPILIEAFDQNDTAGRYLQAHRAILEAVGKTGTKESLVALANVITYRTTDTLLLEGQAWGIYRFALRNITDEVGTQRMIDLAVSEKFPTSVRFIAANYLLRAAIQVDSSRTDLVSAFTDADDPRIRMALAIGLGKMQSLGALTALQQQFPQEEDWRVKTNILRAFGNFDYFATREVALGALRDPNAHVAKRAAQHFLENGNARDAVAYWRIAKEMPNWSVKYHLYAAANRHLPAYMADTRNAINFELVQAIQKAVSPYEKAAAVDAYAEFNWNYRNIWNLTNQATEPVVRSAGLYGLQKISEADNFASFFGLSNRRVRVELANFFKLAIETGDVGRMAIAAGGLRFEDGQYQNYLDSLNFIEDAMAKLPMPEAIETYNELQSTFDQLSGASPREPKKLDYNHPIDWSLLDQKSDKAPRAVITTPKGIIIMELWPEQAPGSVINLIQLAKDKFFDNKVFHRVVPNFVVQGGCPRGDGYGSLDYSIRSELVPFSYDTAGILGMASAGNHTEGTQFFITHSPTPHLDGNYTAFGKVVRGQEVLDQLQIGDQITSLRIE